MWTPLSTTRQTTPSSSRCAEHSDSHEAVVRGRRARSGCGSAGGAGGASAAGQEQAHLPSVGLVARCLVDVFCNRVTRGAYIVCGLLFPLAVNVGDHVVVFNTKDVVFTGRKWDQKLYRHHTG